MPRRKNKEPVPKYSFITVDPERTNVSWLKVHSGSVRRHAAYWGGPGKFQNENENDSSKQQGDTVAIVSDANEDRVEAAGEPWSERYCIRL
jgi:hypothetical protein